MARTSAVLGSTSATKTPTAAQLTPTWLELRSNLAPTCTPVWEQLCPKLRSIWLQNGGHSRPNPKSSKSPFSLVFSMFFGYWWHFVWSNVPHVGSRLGPTWCEAVAKRAPSCAMLTWTFMCITWLQFGVHLDGSGPNFSPTWPIGDDLSSRAQDNATRPGQICRLNVARWKLTFLPLPLFPTFFGFDGGSCKAMLPTLGLSPAQLEARCLHTGPSCAPVQVKLGPSWSQLAASYARSCSAQLKAKDGQVWPQSVFGWAK